MSSLVGCWWYTEPGSLKILLLGSYVKITDHTFDSLRECAVMHINAYRQNER